jgi:hypothetical protein
VSAEFSVSEHNVRNGSALQKTCGILPEFENKKGWPLSDAVTQTVIQFYENESNVPWQQELRVCETAT